MRSAAPRTPIGTVNDIVLAHSLTRAAGALLILDAVHYARISPVDVQSLDPDFLLCSAYKFYGPHVGILYSRAGAPLEALTPDNLIVRDNAAPYRIETGTLNHAAIEGVGAAIDYLAGFGRGASRHPESRVRYRRRDRQVRIRAWAISVVCTRLPGVRLWGLPFTTEERAATVSFSVAGQDCGALARKLGAVGICVWGWRLLCPTSGGSIECAGSLTHTRGVLDVQHCRGSQTPRCSHQGPVGNAAPMQSAQRVSCANPCR